MSQFEGKPISDLIFKMENDFELFDLASEEGIPIWDVLRWDVLMAIKIPGYIEVAQKRFEFKQKLSRLCDLPFELYFFFKFLLKPYDYFFLSHRRYRKGGVPGFYDPFFESVYDAAPQKKIAHYLINDNYRRGSRKDKVYNIIPFMYRLKTKIKNCNKDEKIHSGINSICDAVRKSFGVTLDYRRLIQNYEYFLFEYHFYKWVLKFKKIRHVFFYLAGIQKALVLAAKKNNIPVSEFQHGDVVYETTYYLYKPLTQKVKNNTICPDNFFVFSDLWVKNIKEYINSNCISIGSDFFYKEKKGIQNLDAIALISSKQHNDILKNLAVDIAKENPALKIYFKLHPIQFNTIEQHRLFFQNYSNIVVVTVEYNMSDLINMADEFIAIYSTAMYEVLQAGKILYVLKEFDYLSFRDFFNEKNVYLINDAQDLIAQRKDAFENYSTDAPVFFERFNKNFFLENILSNV